MRTVGTYRHLQERFDALADVSMSRSTAKSMGSDAIVEQGQVLNSTARMCVVDHTALTNILATIEQIIAQPGANSVRTSAQAQPMTV